MKFVKNNYFIMGNRRFRVITGMVLDTRFPTFAEDRNQVGNCVEFIEIEQRTELGETEWVEVAPKLIANPKNEDEKYFNDWAKMCGSNIRPKTLLYSLIEQNKLQII
ncbi:MAG TPA: hypothetical protein PLD87_10090 [Bacteroidia bacterium]|nr:hypothetical protein [Bacteroidia bacterium]